MLGKKGSSSQTVFYSEDSLHTGASQVILLPSGVNETFEQQLILLLLEVTPNLLQHMEGKHELRNTT